MKTKLQVKSNVRISFLRKLCFVCLCLLLLLLMVGRSAAQTYTVLRNLTAADGANSHSGLVLSGTTLYGAANEGGSPPYGSRGTVFKLNTDGTGFTVIRNFNIPGLGDGPIGDLVLSGTTLYGTTYMGGSNNYGVLFSMGTDGSNYSVLKHFSIGDGAEPGGVRLFGDTLYGSTMLVNVLFKIGTDGSNYTVTRRFTSNSYARPELLRLGTELYGTGGVDSLGTAGVFKVDTNGNNFTVLRSFAVTEGDDPEAGLVSYSGWLYGTMSGGGSNNCGTIFKITSNGFGFAILKQFAGYDGVNPVKDLVRTNNTLFGITDTGGSANLGTIFMLNTDGAGFQVLKSFTGPDGSYPGGTLLLIGSTLYGTTRYGGSYNNGVIFALTLPPTNRPPVAGTPFIKVIGDEVSVIPARRFLIWCSDPDNDPLSLSAVTSPSAKGALVTLETNQVLYAPPAGFLGDDTFGYTITDGNGGFASGTASILVEPRRFGSATMLLPITSPGALQVNFTGFADLGYTVERAESLDGPWTPIGDVLTDDNGAASFTDRNPPSSSAFYRAVH